MATCQRRQKFVDRHVQGSAMLRMAVYWLLCCMTIATVVLIWRVVVEPPQLFRSHIEAMWEQYFPVILALVLLLPLMLVDVVGWTNRLAGPMVRLRRAMQRLADGEKVEPIALRDNDFWRDFAADFNRLVARVERLEAAQRQEASAVEPEAHAEQAERSCPVA